MVAHRAVLHRPCVLQAHLVLQPLGDLGRDAVEQLVVVDLCLDCGRSCRGGGGSGGGGGDSTQRVLAIEGHLALGHPALLLALELLSGTQGLHLQVGRWLEGVDAI